MDQKFIFLANENKLIGVQLLQKTLGIRLCLDVSPSCSLEECIPKAVWQWKGVQFSEKVRQMRKEEVSEHSEFK